MCTRTGPTSCTRLLSGYIPSHLHAASTPAASSHIQGISEFWYWHLEFLLQGMAALQIFPCCLRFCSNFIVVVIPFRPNAHQVQACHTQPKHLLHVLPCSRHCLSMLASALTAAEIRSLPNREVSECRPDLSECKSTQAHLHTAHHGYTITVCACNA